MKRAVVLTLHGVASDNESSIAGQDKSAAKYTITSSTLIEIASLIKSRQNCTLEELVDRTSGEYSTLTFDDGLISDYAEVFPILLDKGVKEHFL